jgi:hypothetical protein
MKNLHKVLKGEHILGLTNVHFEKDMICSACQAGKQVGAHHPHKNIMTTDRPLELLHMDLFDPISYISIDRSNMSIGDVCPKESEQPPQASSIQASPPTQNEEMAQEDEDQDQDDEPPQEEDIDQGGDEDDQD